MTRAELSRRLKEANPNRQPKGAPDKNRDGKGDGGQFAPDLHHAIAEIIQKHTGGKILVRPALVDNPDDDYTDEEKARLAAGEHPRAIQKSRWMTAEHRAREERNAKQRARRQKRRKRRAMLEAHRRVNLDTQDGRRRRVQARQPKGAPDYNGDGKGDGGQFKAKVLQAAAALKANPGAKPDDLIAVLFRGNENFSSKAEVKFALTTAAQLMGQLDNKRLGERLDRQQNAKNAPSVMNFAVASGNAPRLSPNDPRGQGVSKHYGTIKPRSYHELDDATRAAFKAISFKRGRISVPQAVDLLRGLPEFEGLSDEQQWSVVRTAWKMERTLRPFRKLTEGRLNAAQRRASATIIRPGSKRKFRYPIPDKAHARAALARINQSDLTPAEKARVRRKARAMLREFRKDQPRHPRGHPQGGQWRDTSSVPKLGPVRSDLPDLPLLAQTNKDEPILSRITRERRALLDLWTRLNIALDPFTGKDEHTNPELIELADRQRACCKALHHLGRFEAEHFGRKHGPVRDVVIIGAGPAGLSAAVNAGYEGMNALVIEAKEQGGGQAALSSRIENTLPFPVGFKGSQLAQKSVQQAERLRTEFSFGKAVTGVTMDKKTGIKRIELSDGSVVEAHTVIIGTGLHFTKLDKPGLDAEGVVYGSAEELLRQTKRGDTVGIVGAGNSAGQAALNVANSGRKVRIYVRRTLDDSPMSDALKAQIIDHPNVAVLNRVEVKNVIKDSRGHVSGFELTNGTTEDARALGIYIGQTPITDFIDVPKDKYGYIRTGADVKYKERDRKHKPMAFETGWPGVFAVGDVRSGDLMSANPQVRKVLPAAAAGSVAISMAHHYLDEQRGQYARLTGERMRLMTESDSDEALVARLMDWDARTPDDEMDAWIRKEYHAIFGKPRDQRDGLVEGVLEVVLGDEFTEYNRNHLPKGAPDRNKDGKGDGGQFTSRSGLSAAGAPASAIKKAAAAAAKTAARPSKPKSARATPPKAPPKPTRVERVEDPERFTRAVEEVAAKAHDSWREGRKKADGSYEPRMKDDGQGGRVDIANTAYKDLPPKWQAENKAGALSAVKAVRRHPDDIEAAAARVHDDWVSRNGSWASPELRKPYAELSEEEKEKDRVFVRNARTALGLSSSPRRIPPTTAPAGHRGRVPAHKEAEVRAALESAFAKSEMGDAPMQDFKSLDEMLAIGPGVKAEFDGVLASVVDDLKGHKPSSSDEALRVAASRTHRAVLVTAPLKGRDRAEEKIRDKYTNRGGHNRLRDVVRGTIVLNNLRDAPRAMDTLRRAAAARGFTLHEAGTGWGDPPPRPPFWGPSGAGYRDLAVLLRHPNGMICELQINAAPMFVAKQGNGHEWYKELRTLDVPPGNTKPEVVARISELNRLSDELYQRAWEQAHA